MGHFSDTSIPIALIIFLFLGRLFASLPPRLNARQQGGQLRGSQQVK